MATANPWRCSIGALHVAAERGFFDDAGDRSGHKKQSQHCDLRHLREIRKLLLR